MGGSQPAGQTTTTQKADPWTGQQPYLKQGFAGAQNLYENFTPGYYPNSTNAPMNAWQSSALQGLYNRGMAGTPMGGAAQDLATSTLQGDFLSAGNPYFANVQQQIANSITPQVMSSFESSGRYGSGAAAHALASALADSTGRLAYQNYGDERMRQMQTMGMVPSLGMTDLVNLSAASQAGDQLQQQQQQAINADKARYDYFQQLPQQQLQNYLGSVQGQYGQASTTSQPYFTNPGAGILGGILGLASLF